MTNDISGIGSWKRGAALETMEINSQSGNPYNIPKSSHAVLTLGYSSELEHPTNRVYRRVVEFLQQQFADDRNS